MAFEREIKRWWDKPDAEKSARFFHQIAHRMRAAHDDNERAAAKQRQDIADRITSQAIALLGEYAETVQSKAKMIEINSVIIALGGTPRTVESYDPTNMTIGLLP